ncbi:DUF6274 family protein [Streptomyces albulus]|nr:DUF6274 family protein [Streptomyces noursei]
MTTAVRHETRALLRAHLSAALRYGYRHLTRQCPVCHQLLRLAMEPHDARSGPAAPRAPPTPPGPPASRRRRTKVPASGDQGRLCHRPRGERLLRQERPKGAIPQHRSPFKNSGM